MNIAVIGGGFSGLTASYLLEKRGFNVTIFEKNEELGGHCKTFSTKNTFTELGTLCSFTSQIKELLIELQIDYTERFIYRNFLDEDFNFVELLSSEDVLLLLNELDTLKKILEMYSPYLKGINYGYIHPDLLVPLNVFLKKHNLKYISQVISPYLSSFGFGSISDIQTYYVFKVFDINTISSFIDGNKSLFISNGTCKLISKLSERISDIRYSLEVNGIEICDGKVKVETPYTIDYFDKVFIACKLNEGVLKDNSYNNIMKKFITNSFVSCAYEINNNDIVTTYFKSHLGKKNKIQFFYTSSKNNRNILVAYAYGNLNKEIVHSITTDIQNLNIDINHLITAKEWSIFPHINSEDLNPSFYSDLYELEKNNPIYFIGSLISKNTIDNLYLSIKDSIDRITNIDNNS